MAAVVHVGCLQTGRLVVCVWM